MAKFVIGRPVNGISLNGLEYVCDENGNTLFFNTKEDAEEFLKSHGYTEDDMEAEGICIIEDYAFRKE